MKLFREYFFLLIAFIALNGCTPPMQYQSKLDPLALQQMQTQEFETSKQILFAATVSVFQDTGFTIEAASLESGIITAKSPNTTKSMGLVIATLWIRTSAFVEETRPGFAKVRLNYTESTSYYGGYGESPSTDIPNEDPAYYEKIFNKIREAVFLREAYKATPKSPK